MDKVITVADLRKILTDTLERLDEIGDEGAEVKVAGNTYFLGYPEYYLSIAGFGFVALSEIDLEGAGEEEEV